MRQRQATLEAMQKPEEVKCHYCPRILHRDRGEITKDHIVAKSRGGKNEVSNYVWCDILCNNIKGSRDYGWFIEKLKEHPIDHTVDLNDKVAMKAFQSQWDRAVFREDTKDAFVSMQMTRKLETAIPMYVHGAKRSPIREKAVRKTMEFPPERAYELALDSYKRFGMRGLSPQWREIFKDRKEEGNIAENPFVVS